ncbi:MAG: hypothetical protein IPM50_06580 [Acidobacteriota bacterium]|nr:MAG: hypothetical protein IPM50_06580 [Acidobacteriota bacterium]
MRALVPAETLVYMESNDLAALLQPVVTSRQFSSTAASKPDLSPMKGVQAAVAVTGFELTEEKVNEEQSIAKVQPRFVVVADTKAWNYQAVAFAEHKLGELAAGIFGGEATLEAIDKHGGKFFVWTARDGRKAHALVIDSLIWFGNDENAIEKSLAARRGETPNISSTGKIQPPESGTLARGYVSTDGIAQIANLAAMKIATEAGDENELRTVVAAVLPEMIRSSATEIRWTSFRAEQGIEDRFAAVLPAERKAANNEMLTELLDSFFEGIEQTTGEEIAEAIGDRRENSPSAPNRIHRREDHFTTDTAERRVTSDLGFVGWLIAQMAGE